MEPFLISIGFFLPPQMRDLNFLKLNLEKRLGRGAVGRSKSSYAAIVELGVLVMPDLPLESSTLRRPVPAEEVRPPDAEDMTSVFLRQLALGYCSCAIDSKHFGPGGRREGHFLRAS